MPVQFNTLLKFPSLTYGLASADLYVQMTGNVMKYNHCQQVEICQLRPTLNVLTL